MTSTHGKRICDRCGESITAYCPSIETLSEIGHLGQKGDQATVDEIVRREGVAPDVIWEYLRHRMKPTCKPKVVYCPSCGGQLRTWRARQCMHCLSDWH